MSESIPRFYIDERVGCIAIRDRTIADPDEPNRPGLHPDMPGVVWYRSATHCPKPPCVCCGHSNGREWRFSSGDKIDALLECARLNALAGATP